MGGQYAYIKSRVVHLLFCPQTGWDYYDYYDQIRAISNTRVKSRV